MTEVSLVARKAIAAFSAERLLFLPWAEMVAFLVSIEEILIPDAEKEDTVTHWLALAEEARDENDLELARRYCRQAGGELLQLQELSLHEFAKQFGATSLFRLEKVLFLSEEEPFEEALRHMQSFVDAFNDPLPSVEEIKRGITPKGVTIPIDPVRFAREARQHVQSGDVERARRLLRIINNALTGLIDAAVARNWQLPQPFGAILNR